MTKKKWGTKTLSNEQRIGELSGGNQEKALLESGCSQNQIF